MEITQHPSADLLELRLTGRLDATWADHVSKTIENAVRAGSHRIVLNFAGVNYISSLGIRVLVHHFQRLRAVNGSLSISHPNDFTRSVLQETGLLALLLDSSVAAASTLVPRSGEILARGGATYQTYPQAVSTPLSCTATGRPEQLRSTGYAEPD